VIDFVSKARACNKSEAARELIAMSSAGLRDVHFPCHRASTSKPSAAGKAVQPMPPDCRAAWDEGVRHLLANETMQRQIDEWRSWIPGTARLLAEDGLMGCPLNRGRRQTAFVVQSPYRDQLGCISTRDVGYHIRLKPRKDERASWLYEPNLKKHGTGCPALPFVLGGGFVPYATTIIGTEGQWDAITLASAAGWLVSDSTWPECISVFGTRGADGWRTLIEAWGRHWRADARFVLFPDADEAGDRWSASHGFVDALRTRKHQVRVIRSNEPGAKDLNDLHQRRPLTKADINLWLQEGRAPNGSSYDHRGI
jgi:hypothetical protein